MRKGVAAVFSPDPEYMDRSLNKFDSTLTFSKVLEPVRVNSNARFDDYQQTPVKKYSMIHRKHKQMGSLKKPVIQPL